MASRKKTMDEERHRGKSDFVFLCSLIGGRVDLLPPKATVIVTLHALLLSD